MKRIIFVDIDGTIISCSKGLNDPSKNTIEAFKKIKENGDYVFIASGRAKCLLPKSIISLNPSGYILANGAYAEMDNKILFMESMDLITKNKIMEFTDNYQGSYYLETIDVIYTKDLNLPVHKDYIKSWNVMECYQDTGYNDDLNINIGMMAFMNDYKKEVYEELSPYVDVNPHIASNSFDLNIKGVNKGTAIIRVCEMLGIDIINTYAFGDGINDIEMLSVVNNSVAMDNACDELKNVAKDITDNVLDDGFYNYLIKYKIIDN